MYRGMLTGLPDESVCRVCESVARSQRDFSREATLVSCPICGVYSVTLEADIRLENLRPMLRQNSYKLSFAIRSALERIYKPRAAFVLLADDIDKYLLEPDLSVQQKLRLLLQFLGRLSGFPGEEVQFNGADDYSAIAARNRDEAEFYLQTVANQLFVSLGETSQDEIARGCTVSAEGWLELERIEQSGADSQIGFIAMSFDASRSAADAAITAAITKAGYRPIRIDREEHLNRIDDEIIARIRQSKFLVADFTGHRNGVYFEAGFMLGLGRPVIWVCEKGELDKAHFDTRQYNTIAYSDTADLEKRLQLRIEANLGKGPIEHT